jgi:hypothetical protein
MLSFIFVLEYTFLNTKKDHDIDVGNLAPTLGEAQHYGVVKPVNEISTLHS